MKKIIKFLKGISTRKKLSVLIVISLLTITIAISFGYFILQVAAPAITDLFVGTSKSDRLTFTPGTAIKIYASQNNFGLSDGNLTDESTTSASLIKGTDGDSTTHYYNVLLNIIDNNFVYTTPDKKPEIILELVDPSGNIVTNVTGLDYVEVEDHVTNEIIKGFDITDNVGLSRIVTNYEISSSSEETATLQEWKIKVTLVNLTTIQSENEGKELNLDIVLTQEDVISTEAPYVELNSDYQENVYGWTNKDVKVDLNITEPAAVGIKETKYCIGSKVCDPNIITENTEIVVSSDGDNILCVSTESNNDLGMSTCSEIFSIDKTAPEAGMFDIKGVVGNNNWYTSVININAVSGEDELSEEELTVVDFPVISEDTAGQEVTLTTIDKAGNISTRKIIVKKDSTAPIIMGNANQTHQKNDIVNVLDGVACTDNLSSKDNCIVTATPTSIDTSRAGTHEITYTSIDAAGNKTEEASTIYIDADEPNINLVEAPGAINGNGWAKENFAVNVNLTDNSGLGIKETEYCVSSTECTPNESLSGNVVTISNEGDNVVCVNTTDNNNKTATTCSEIYKLDKTAPVAGNINLSGTKGTNNWYRSNITASVTNGSDSLSGHYSTTIDKTSITSDTIGTTITLTTTDLAGNTSTKTTSVKKDATNPTAGTINVSGTVGWNSWYTTNVTISRTSGTDSTSGILSSIVSHTSITSNTSGITVTLTTKDNAGNQATTTRVIKRDATRPTLTAKSGTVTIDKGTSVNTSTYFNSPSYSISGYNSYTCNPSNTSSLTAGTKTVSCTATSKNGLSTTTNKSIIVQEKKASTYLPSIHGPSQGLLHHTSALENGANDNSYRYSGASPNNYVTFNNETWRILGVFGDKIKIVKNEIHDYARWNNSSINKWAESIMYLSALTGDYNAFSQTAKDMVTSGTWYIAGPTEYWTTLNAAHVNNIQRSFTANIGLLSIGEIGYAGPQYSWTHELRNLYSSKTSNWVSKDIDVVEWTISKREVSAYSKYAWRKDENGSILYTSVTTVYAYRPSVFLKSTVKIVSGTGTASNPFILSL